jgi:hypothetical protein
MSAWYFPSMAWTSMILTSNEYYLK